MWNEHLAVHTLARAFRKRVLDDTDDFRVQFVLRFDAADVTPHRTLVIEKVLLEALIHDGNVRMLFHFHAIEVPTYEQRDSHGPEVPRTDGM